MEIDEELKKRGWKLTGKNKNVFGEEYSSQTFADYILKPKGWEKPLITIEAKKVGQSLEDALEQAKKYARKRNAPIAYAIVGSPKKKIIKTWHLEINKPLYFDQKEVNFLLDEKTAFHYINNNEYNPAEVITIENRRQLIQIFSFANNQLRGAGLTEGDERFSEFCSILFLKLLSEDEEKADKDKRRSPETIIPFHLRWEAFKNKEGDELLDHINNALACKGGKHEKGKFCCFQSKYGEDIFNPLQVKKPAILKRIIDKITALHFSSIKSDIKGDAFEYFLKEALKKDKQDLGQYFTPRHIVDFLIRLVDPNISETIYDPFCGTGGILIKAFHYLCEKVPKNDKRKLKRLKEGALYGNELTRIARVAKMNMILTGDGHNNIKRLDSLENPVRGKYDIVITNMPFSLKGPFDECQDLYYLGKASGNSLCIEHILDAINKNYGDRRIALITLEGILTDQKFVELRKRIYENWYVEYIVALPNYAFKPYAEVKTAIFYLTKKREQSHIWHFTVQNDGYTANTKREKKDGENDFDVFWKYKDSEEDKKLQLGFQKLDMEAVKNNNYVSIPNVYKKFTFETQQQLISLEELVEEVNIRNNINAPVWSVTNDRGFVLSEENFSERVASKNISNYKLVNPQIFAYNQARINVGSINYNDSVIVKKLAASVQFT